MERRFDNGKQIHPFHHQAQHHGKIDERNLMSETFQDEDMHIGKSIIENKSEKDVIIHHKF
jgi:hypothetical protein